MSYLHRYSIRSRLRKSVQCFSTFACFGYLKALSGISLYMGYLKGFCIPVIQCYACPLSLFACPIGSLQHFLVIGQFPYYILGIICAIGFSVGRMTCGWLCPFGLFQDFIYRFGRVKWKMPRYMHHTKYIFLVLAVIIFPLLSNEVWFCKICPVGKIEAGIHFILFDSSIRAMLFNPNNGNFVGWWAVLKFFILMLFILLMSVSKRPFCKLLCPMGAIFSLFNRFSIIRLSVNKESCGECNCCSVTCPMDLDVPKELDGPECIRCLKCSACDKVSINV